MTAPLRSRLAMGVLYGALFGAMAVACPGSPAWPRRKARMWPMPRPSTTGCSRVCWRPTPG
jgi:hypothetical protein